MTFLHLGRTQITDAGLDALEPLKKLETIHVTRTAVTDAGAEKLRELLPGCEIVSRVEGE